MSSFYSESELRDIGLISFGKNVFISKKASIYTPENISLGNNVRIDDFCILSGDISLKNNIHISAYTALYGKYGVELDDFTTVSGGNLLYSASDDFSGECLTNPMIPEKYTNVTGGKIVLKKHSIVGAGCVVLPNITLGEGTAIGAMSLVTYSTDPWTIYGGIPIHKIKKRHDNLRNLESMYVFENQKLE